MLPLVWNYGQHPHRAVRNVIENADLVNPQSVLGPRDATQAFDSAATRLSGLVPQVHV